MTSPRRLGVLAAVVLLGGLILAACSAGSRADERTTIAFLRAVPSGADGQEAFLDELRRNGYLPGRNLEVLAADPQEIHTSPEEAQAALEAWQERGVDLVVAYSSAGAMTARATAPDLPVLFLVNDPVAAGLVGSTATPGGRLTGLTYRTPVDRTLSLARRVVTDLDVVGLLVPEGDPAGPPAAAAVEAAAAEASLGVEVRTLADAAGADAAVRELTAAGADVVLPANAPSLVRLLPAIQDAADAALVPVIANNALAERALLVLAPDSLDVQRQLGGLAARLLAGADPASMPVEDPRQFRIRINADVARELGLELPPDVVREADEVVGTP